MKPCAQTILEQTITRRGPPGLGEPPSSWRLRLEDGFSWVMQRRASSFLCCPSGPIASDGVKTWIRAARKRAEAGAVGSCRQCCSTSLATARLSTCWSLPGPSIPSMILIGAVSNRLNQSVHAWGYNMHGNALQRSKSLIPSASSSASSPSFCASPSVVAAAAKRGRYHCLHHCRCCCHPCCYPRCRSCVAASPCAAPCVPCRLAAMPKPWQAARAPLSPAPAAVGAAASLGGRALAAAVAQALCLRSQAPSWPPLRQRGKGLASRHVRRSHRGPCAQQERVGHIGGQQARVPGLGLPQAASRQLG